MFILTISIIFAQFVFSNSQWEFYFSKLTNDQIFTHYTGSWAQECSGGFKLPSSSTTAGFITCTTPATSYITLSNSFPSAQCGNFLSLSNDLWISMDLYFQSTWSAEYFQFTFGAFSYTYTYTSPTTYSFTTGFCNSSPYEIRTLNFTFRSTGNNSLDTFQISSFNANQGQVSVRNIYFSKPQGCYPSCILCSGPNYNQCTSCYYGLPTNNICPTCPSNQFYMKKLGCYDTCDFSNPLFQNGFCQSYPIQLFVQKSVGYETSRWQIIYDPQHMDTSIAIINYSSYGVFKFNSGVYRYFEDLAKYYDSTWLVGLNIIIITFNDIPLNCGIQFKINNTYFGSIFRNASGIQTHKVKIFKISNQGSYLSYTSYQVYEITTYVDIPKYSFLFSVVGNYTDATAGWGIYKISLSSGYCPKYCILCEVSFKCKICESGYYIYRDGTCTNDCYYPYQSIQGSYCYDYDDETPYSSYLIKEHLDETGDPEQYAKYTVISQNGPNFLKGSDIYFSYWQTYRVLGGPFIWAQAKLQRVHDILSPHHSVTIAFYILYGPNFPSDGTFIYTIESNTPVVKTAPIYTSSYYDGSKVDEVYEKINHNTNTLTITWECFGPNNEPIMAYCGIYNYYIAVHNCQPYCLQCQNQSSCTSWNSTYDSNIVKLSQAECLINQYYDKESISCKECPQSCLTCTSKLDCQTCKSTYTQSKLGCICKVNQYEESNQCFDCPIECNQCLTSTYCIECLVTNNRNFSNGQCNCIDGYYHIPSKPQCQLCHQFCKTCFGPTSDECLTCNNIVNIEKVGSTCRCLAGNSYQYTANTCSSCHSSCLTCFKNTIDGCLTCNPSLNRILKGLKCFCLPGYYELSDACTNCPTTENSSLSQCYKLCNNNQLIWHTITCSTCDTGFQLISGECQPICGDLQINGYEQCEDNNTILDDLCYNCQFQCPAHCLTCDQSTIFPCPDICGDGIISGIEECEDGNNTQYDGCFNCKYQCPPQCTKCIKGQCFECNTGGWQTDLTVTPWKCKEICGDGLIVGIEQCDDENSFDTDGCKDCKYYCRIGCSSCDYTTNKCLSCEFPGFTPISYYCKNICGDGIIALDPSNYYTEQCDDGNTKNYDGCSDSCQLQCQLSSICTICVSNRCELCAVGYYLSNQQICKPICGDSLVAEGEQCEITSILPYKGCQNCLAKCQNSCLTCANTGLGCQTCKTGYNKVDYLCYSICGDKIITEDEQCDDGNLIIGDGCHFCQFSCQDSCLNCLKGICYDCQEGYQLKLSKCYPMCEDGAQIQNEQCYRITSIQIYPNCQSCQFTCNFNCILCQFGICQQCKDGYELNPNLQICTESLEFNYIVIENCNIQIGDNCVSCKDYAYYEKSVQKCQLKEAPLTFCEYYLRLSPDLYCSYCIDYCVSCNENKCLNCQRGYYLDENFSCISSCGDGILAHDEQCEIFDKNCLSCMLDAPKQCEKHFQDHCYECKQGYYFNEYLNTCESVCGDGIITHDEDCEDNNFIEFDGCNHCKYSCSQQCINCLNGVCQECKRDYFLRDGFCYYEGTIVDFYRYCQLNLNRDCLICVKDYKLNEYGDCVPESSENCIQYYNSQCIQCAQKYELYENQCIQSQQCQVGLYLDQNSFICQSQCGDGYITEWEECDDQNMEHFDGCYQCKYECDENCIQCVYGECLQCSQEFNLIESKCSSKCQDICINCVQGRCQLCRSGYFLNEYLICIIIDCEYDFSSTPYCGNGIIEDIEQCDDQNLLNDDGCNNYCEKTCDVNCTHCIDDVCFECKEGWKLGSFFCDPICGDFIVVGNEECDDGNYINFDGCFECKYQCSQSCENCLNGICQSCQLNFEFDQLNNSCKPIQTLLTIYEEPNCKLLEGNQCILCQFGYLDAVTQTCIVDYNMNQCNKNCKSCVLSKCLECEFGYYGTKCIPKCGDGIIVQEEECDDGIQYQLDDCLNCKYQCPQYCKSCAYGDCTNCFAGFYLDIVSNTCNSVCGDNLLASDEVCDDGNELRYDGCFECKYQCQEACLDCQFGKCMLCQLPFIVVHTKSMCEETKSCEDLIGLYYDNDSNDCLPLCGDEIVAGNEDCEDLNSIPDDGCYKCKFECSKNCQICKDRVCIQCQTNYLLNNYQCLLDKSNVSLNSSIIEEPEGNNLDTEIKIETQINSTSTDSTKVEQSSWKDNKVCRDDECVYSKKAIMQLTYNKQLYALQYVNINFDQEVKIKDNILKDKQLFNISIADLDTQYYNITINAIQDISFDPSNAQYQVSIEIFQQISTKPILLVQLNKDVVNSNNQTIFNPSESIILQLPQIISGEQKQLSIYAQSSNKAFMIGAIIISAVSLVSGQSSFVIETLNLLQYQSFLRFINIDYPENLQIYFQAQELLSLTSYLNLFEADDYLNLITRKEKQLELSGKFQQYHVEVDLFTNILPQLFQVLALLPLLYFAKNLFLQFLRLSKYMKSLEYQTTIQSKILFAIISLLLNFKNSITQIMKIRYLQNLNKMLQPIYINSWDLIFKVILQLYYNRISNLRSILTTFFAISIFLMCLCLLLKLFSICSNSQNNKIQVIQQVKFIALDISRTMFFHIVLIEFQTEQILQLLLISFSNVSSFYITYQYKLCSKSDRIILLIIEGVLTVFSLSLFLYFEFTQIAISYENKVTLGFIQMYFLIMCLGIVFAKQLYPKVQIVLRQMCKQENVKVASNKLFS